MIGKTLRDLLAKQRMPVSELARRVGVPQQTMYSIIRRDNMKIDFDVLLRICQELNVPLEVFYNTASAPDAPDARELALLAKIRSLDRYGRNMTEMVVDREMDRMKEQKQEQERLSLTSQGGKRRIIPLYLTPAAAGYASPALDEDYEDYEVDANCSADFAVRIAGDSMEPQIPDGSVVLVKRSAIRNGDVGMFFVDGDMKCKQYLRDNFGNVYLLSLNRSRSDADVSVPASSGITLCCFGKVLMDQILPAPEE